MPTPCAGQNLRRAIRLLLLCFMAMLGANLATSAQAAAGAFNSTGSMAVARQLHTATLLPNGQVLVAGGEGTSGSLQSAELYDPATGSWNSTGSLTAPRSSHTATLLPSGKVLIAGGAAGGTALATAELYDPATGVWSSTGSLAAPLQGHTATLLFSGQVLVAGGKSASSSAQAQAQLYDPVSGTWSSTGSLQAARFSHSATLLPNGTVLVAGGSSGPNVYLSSAELYDPASGAWTATGSLSTARTADAAALLANGKVLFVGSETSAGSTTKTELYDPASGTWSVTASINLPHAGDAGAMLADGRFFMPASNDGSFPAQLYDAQTGTWAGGATLAAASKGPTSTLLPSGQVLVAGGVPWAGGAPLKVAELFDPLPGGWVSTAASSLTHLNATATLMPDGRALVVGGAPAGTQSVELYNPATELWTTTGALKVARKSHSATLLPSGKLLVAGGTNNSPAQEATAELYDPTTAAWAFTGNMGIARASHSATLLPSGQVLVVGGMNPGVLATCQLYDPAGGTWSMTGSLTTARYGHTAVLLASGKVLVAGGHASPAAALASAELYDPASGTWSDAGALATARFAHTASLLPSGQVLVAGGDGGGGGNPLNSAELYDPGTGLWSAAGNLATARYSHTATLLPNGVLLVVAGANNGGYLSSTELYDPAQGTWQAGESLTGARFSHTATLFPSGQVLVVGGNGPSGPLNTAELRQTRDAFAPPHVASATIAQDGTVTIQGDHLLGSGMVVQLRNVANGQIVILQPSGSVTSTSYTSLPVNTLAPGTYLVTVIANGHAGASALVQSSTTAVLVFTQPATGVEGVRATLQARVVTAGAAASVGFEYSTDPAFAQNVTTTPTAATLPAGGAGNLSLLVNGLARTTTYYFRAVATNASMTVRGGILSFTTVLLGPTDATPPDATIAPAGNLLVPRSIDHSAILLPSGKVLVVGGRGSTNTPLFDAELFDPASGGSQATGSSLYAHLGSPAVLLPNGKVFLTNANIDQYGELYDPVAGTWSTPTIGGYRATVTLLSDGRVLIAGGLVNVYHAGFPRGYYTAEATNIANLYNPASATGSMTISRSASTATLLRSGKVLVAGDGATAELWDPGTGSWFATGNMTQARSGQTAVLLPNGLVLAVGGGTADLYDQATGNWTATGSPHSAQARPTATVLPNGKVWMTGTSNSSSEVYDPATGTWTLAGNFATARTNLTATLLPNGDVYVAGGATAEIYSPAKGSSSAATSPGTARGGHTATVLPSGQLLVAGGTNAAAGASHGLAAAELYDATNGAWTPTGNLTGARLQHSATLLLNGKVLVAGGLDGNAVATSELYDPAGGTWTASGNLSAARFNHTASLLAGGKVLVAGGGNAGGLLAAAELYDPATATWTTTGRLATPRKFHTATALANGQVLVAGGWDATGHSVVSAELYNPASGTWQTVGNLVTARANHGAMLLPDGRVLAAGGRNDDGLLVATEVYDPASATWKAGRDLYEARAFQTATLLTNGKVLMADGVVAAQAPDPGLHASGEIYNPATGTWISAGPLVQGRTGHTASLLPTGQVVVVGGDGADTAGTAELYDPGLGFDPARQPQLLTASATFGAGRPLTLSGVRLSGPVGAGSGTLQDSYSYFPVVQVRNLATDQVQTLLPSPSVALSTTSWTSAPPSGLPVGLYAVTLSTNGIPSNSLVAQVDSSGPVITTNAATGLAARGATLNAQVTSNGLATTVSFAYATDPAVTQNVVTTPAQAFTANASGAPVSQAITGLSPHRTYYYQAIATNSDSTVKGAIVSFTTDNTAPIAPAGTATATTGDAKTITLPYAATDADGDALTLVSANGPNLTINGTNGNQVTFTPDTAFVGTATLTYQISDGTGLANGTASGAISVTVSDNDAPDTSITSAPSGVITTNAVSISFSGMDNVGVASFQGRLDGAAFAPVTSPVNLTGLADGAHTYDVRALDAAGNVDATPARASWSVNTTVTPVDTTPPVLHLPADFTVEATSAAGAVVTYTASATDTGSGVASSSFTPASGSQFALGTTVVQATATDVAGNTSTGTFQVTVRDTSPPDTIITSAPSGTIRSDAATITFSGTDAVGVKSFQGRLDGAAFAPVTSPVNLSGLPDGAHTYDVRALDAAGNVDATPARASWTVDTTVTPVDTTPPVLHLPADFTVEATSAAGAVVTYTASATDTGSGVAGSSFTPASGSQFALGTTLVQATATDVAGNTSTGSFQVTVRDSRPPVIVLNGANPLHVALNGSYQDPGATATDVVDGSVAVTVTGTVDVTTSGSYTITYHATDATAHSATATRTVIVGNGATVAVDDHYFSGSGTQTPLALHVLDNDTAVHPALLTVSGVTRPLYGSAVIASDGRSITYTPAISYASFAGTESFSYTVRDEFGATATARVNISNGAYREKGLYDGLLADHGKVVGYVQVNLTATGVFTGTLKAGVTSSVVRGQFDVDQHATVALLGASLDLEFDGQANMSASYVRGALTGQGVLSHVTYNMATNPAPQAGSYTVLLPPAPAPGGTAATATVVVDPTTHKVSTLQLTSGGSGYLTSPLLTILSPVGSGATAAATLTNGAVTGLTLSNPGARYPTTGVAVQIDPPGAELPTGTGYATMKVSQSGAVTLAGQVGDGTMLSASGWLKEDHTLALYSIVAYRPGPSGTLSGVVTFDEVQDVSDLDGDLAWSKPRQTGAALYRNGFETTSHLIGSHYRPPLRGEQALVFTNTVTGVATLTADNGDVLNPINDTVSVNSANLVKKTSAGADRLLMRIVPSTGLFSGTVLGVYPIGTTATKTVSTAFAGVLFPKQNLGQGLVIGPRHTGELTLMPQ